MSISSVVTRGFGYSIGFVARAGYNSTAGVADVPAPPAVVLTGDGALSWQDAVQAKFRLTHLVEVIEKKTKELRKVEKKIRAVEQKLKTGRTEGILANFHLLEMKKDEIRNEIRGFKLEMIPLDLFIKKQEEDDEDERDIEMLILQ